MKGNPFITTTKRAAYTVAASLLIALPVQAVPAAASAFGSDGSDSTQAVEQSSSGSESSSDAESYSNEASSESSTSSSSESSTSSGTSSSSSSSTDQSETDESTGEDSSSSDSSSTDETVDENTRIIQEARAAGLAGVDALEKYLAGGTLTNAEILSIDTAGLSSISPSLASTISALQSEASSSDSSNADSGSSSSDSSSSDSSKSSTKSSDSESAKSDFTSNVTDDTKTPGMSETTTTDEDGNTETNFSFSPNPTTDEFISSICEDAREIGQENDLYASVMIAQAVLESGSGSSQLSKAPYYNLFGIKGSYNGNSVSFKTQEDDGNGNYSTITASFRDYSSTKESLQDYANLVTKEMASYYAPILKSNTSSYVDACDYLQGHYATSTTYSKKLQAIISAYDLTQYDNPKADIKSDSDSKKSESDAAEKDPKSLASLSAMSNLADAKTIDEDSNNPTLWASVPAVCAAGVALAMLRRKNKSGSNGITVLPSRHVVMSLADLTDPNSTVMFPVVGAVGSLNSMSLIPNGNDDTTISFGITEEEVMEASRKTMSQPVLEPEFGEEDIAW
ncbi:MAG: glucosaminidase domain-containing protein [Coriobacteriales bacterium]